jgi:hypothetical protein
MGDMSPSRSGLLGKMVLADWRDYLPQTPIL